MPDAATYEFFVAAALALVPGLAVLYVVARGVEGGLHRGQRYVSGVYLGLGATAAASGTGKD